MIINDLYQYWLKLKANHSKLYLMIVNFPIIHLLLIRFYFYTKTKQDSYLVCQVYDILSDKESIDVYNAIIENRNNWLIKKKYNQNEGELYFCLNEFGVKLTANEVFIDGGAYTGDTLNRFIQLVDNKYTHAYCFEPDPSNFEKLKNNVNFKGYKNVTLYSRGLWREAATLSFNQSGSTDASFVVGGPFEVRTVSLDQIIPIEQIVTFIKMDIEGSEMEALQGCERIILQYRPKLAISLYHRPEDIYKIPLYISRKYPFYKLYIRHHSKTRWDTILYAIPDKCEI